MKVETRTNDHHATQPQRVAPAARPASASFAATLAATQAEHAGSAGGAREADFTSMTRQEMRDWVNTRILSGDMSLDDSRPLMAMTMKIPAGGAPGVAAAAEADGTRYDFMQLARDGLRGALSRNDQATLEMLKSAMSIMSGQQRHATGIDSHA